MDGRSNGNRFDVSSGQRPKTVPGYMQFHNRLLSEFSHGNVTKMFGRAVVPRIWRISLPQFGKSSFLETILEMLRSQHAAASQELQLLLSRGTQIPEYILEGGFANRRHAIEAGQAKQFKLSYSRSSRICPCSFSQDFAFSIDGLLARTILQKRAVWLFSRRCASSWTMT